MAQRRIDWSLAPSDFRLHYVDPHPDRVVLGLLEGDAIHPYQGGSHGLAALQPSRVVRIHKRAGGSGRNGIP